VHRGLAAPHRTCAAAVQIEAARSPFGLALPPLFRVGQHLFRINESLTLDSPEKLDSNRYDSE
jgi:hypothetical protein